MKKTLILRKNLFSLSGLPSFCQLLAKDNSMIFLFGIKLFLACVHSAGSGEFRFKA